MTTEEFAKYVMVPVKRHINMGERTFHNAETRMQKVCGSTIDAQQAAQRELREALNVWELEEHENYLKMQHQLEEQEKEFQSQKQLEQDLKDAEFRIELLDFVKKNPGATMDTLVVTFEKTQRTISNHIWKLKEDGLIKNQECKQSFIIEDERFLLEEEEVDLGT